VIDDRASNDGMMLATRRAMKAFVLGLDGNGIEVVLYGPAKRSSGAIEITF
jgi:hypothetical protein